MATAVRQRNAGLNMSPPQDVHVITSKQALAAYDCEHVIRHSKIISVDMADPANYILPTAPPYAFYTSKRRTDKPGSNGLADWLRLLKYQYSITVGFYALTWTESIILHGILLVALFFLGKSIVKTALYAVRIYRYLRAYAHLLNPVAAYHAYHASRRPLDGYERARLWLVEARRMWRQARTAIFY